MYQEIRRRLDDAEAYFTMFEAGILLGVQSETVRKRALAKEIDFTRVGREYRFYTNDIRVYLGWPALPRKEHDGEIQHPDLNSEGG